MKNISLERLAEELGTAKKAKEAATEYWTELRLDAISRDVQEFSSPNYKVRCVTAKSAKHYDTEKLDKYFRKNSISPSRFKVDGAATIRVLVKSK